MQNIIFKTLLFQYPLIAIFKMLRNVVMFYIVLVKLELIFLVDTNIFVNFKIKVSKIWKSF